MIEHEWWGGIGHEAVSLTGCCSGWARGCVRPYDFKVLRPGRSRRHSSNAVTSGGKVEGGCQQFARICVLRIGEDAFGRPFFHNASLAHDDDVVAECADNLEVVADEKIGKVVLSLQVTQQIDDLRLHAHVEGACRLVQHDEFRLENHGSCNGDTLALAA